MNRLAAALACLATALAFGLAGCAGPSHPPVAQTTTVVYRPWTTAVLLTTSDPTLTPAALESRRPAALAYLQERGFLTSRDTLVPDAARADRLLRIVVGADGGFDVTVFTTGGGSAGGAILYDPSTTIIESTPVLPRTFRNYPRSYADPFYRDPFNDPLWPTPEFFYHRRYGEPDPSYRRYPRPQPPPVIVQPIDPPPARPHEPPPTTNPPPSREPPPPPPAPRRDDDRRHDDVRDQYPRPPK